MYCPDLEEYKKERGFEIPLESYPFPIAHDNEELIKNIENFDEENYKIIEQIALDSDLLSRKKAESIAFVAKYHNADNIAKEYLNLWQSLL